MLNLLAASAALSCLAAPLPAPSGLSSDQLNPIGEATFKKSIFKLYDASLCADKPQFEWDSRFVLNLEYRRGFSSNQLVKATMVEMSRLSGRDEESFETLREPIAQCFPDVNKGDVITGVSFGKDQAVFYLNGEPSCDIVWSGFREDFFGIWLSDESRDLKKSRRLRGLAE